MFAPAVGMALECAGVRDALVHVEGGVYNSRARLRFLITEGEERERPPIWEASVGDIVTAAVKALAPPAADEVEEVPTDDLENPELMLPSLRAHLEAVRSSLDAVKASTLRMDKRLRAFV
jgi:hypothetical protein